MTVERPRAAAGTDLLFLREERVAAEELVEAAGERFALLYQVGKKVLSASSLEDVNELALSLVFECLRAERGALLLRDPESGEFLPQVLRHREGGEFRREDLRVPRSIVSEVVSGRVGILTSDALFDERFESRPSIRGSHIRSALCAPLWAEEQVLGVIYLDSLHHTYAFTRADLELLNAIANLIAIRLKQDLLYKQLSRERVVRSNLARYHSPDVVDAILARATDPGQPEVGFEEREVSILFADLHGFTRLAETASPSVVAGLLNEYYNVGTGVIFEFGGTVMDFVGDSVMAVFGAPVAHPDHARRAVQGGVELLRRMGAAHANSRAGLRPEVRVAINSGRVVVGNIGSPERLKYAVVGDPVNVAARLEALGEANTVTIGEETYRRLEGRVPCDDLGPQQLRGREVPVRSYRVRS